MSLGPTQPSSWQLPPAMSDTAPPIDSTYNFIFWFSVVFTVGITGALIYFIMKYKRVKGVKSEPTGHFNRLEIFWTVTPTIFIGVLFHVGFVSYIKNATAAEGATEIRVRGKKWSWEFEYPSGDRIPGELTLEEGRPYKMIMSSDDVIHSFYIPEFRLKRDVVPGQYSFIQFTPLVTGEPQEAHVFCAEFCGTSHSGMLATVKILPKQQYKEFEKTMGKCVGTPEECTPAKWGEKLFVKNNCPTCHGAGGSGEIGGGKSPGPKLAGLFAKGQETTTAGPVTVDENYIRESILRPNAKIVAGYSTVQMPAFVLKDDQLDAVIAYVKSLK
ncbi:MAG: cytochrome c oxidase subunit II [Deltaproteobacteria bacterium]|nr:cytochrome c oxidase subunit II [Deltaproteobacteria bacterium]